jgi:hypothetical protein
LSATAKKSHESKEYRKHKGNTSKNRRRDLPQHSFDTGGKVEEPSYTVYSSEYNADNLNRHTTNICYFISHIFHGKKIGTLISPILMSVSLVETMESHLTYRNKPGMEKTKVRRIKKVIAKMNGIMMDRWSGIK